MPDTTYGDTQYRTDLHAHFCATCNGYSPCHGYGANVPCLLTDDCVQCGRILEGMPSVAVKA